MSHQFCPSFSYFNDTFSACLVARSIAGSHFVAVCTCSEARVPHINNHTTTMPHLHHKLTHGLDDDHASARDVQRVQMLCCNLD